MDEVLVDEKIQVNEVYDDERQVEHEHEVSELLERVEARLDIELHEINEQINLTDETEVELIDMVDEDDGDEVIHLYEMVVEMMISEDEDEVVTY